MKRFEWRLQRVLDIKEKVEQVRRAELLHIGERLAEARVALLGQQRILREGMLRVALLAPQERMAKQAMFLKHTAVNDDQINKLKNWIESLGKEHEAKAAEVLALRRETEGLQRLREKAKRTFMIEQEKHQQSQDDDRSGMAYTRKLQSQEKAAMQERS